MNFLRASFTNGASRRLFSTTAARQSDIAKLTLVGRMINSEAKVTSSNKEYVTYTVSTRSYSPQPPNPDGTRPRPRITYHNVYCFAPGSFEYVRNIEKGSLVYAEASYDLREPDPSAEPGTPFAQRQVFLRHDNLRILRAPLSRYLERGTESEPEPEADESSRS